MSINDILAKYNRMYRMRYKEYSRNDKNKFKDVNFVFCFLFIFITL